MAYDKLKPNGHLPRVADRQIEDQLVTFGAVRTDLSRYAREVEEGLYVIPIRTLCA